MLESYLQGEAKTADTHLEQNEIFDTDGNLNKNEKLEVVNVDENDGKMETKKRAILMPKLGTGDKLY